ncbi:hypothetical protein RFI_20336 [Reticulomyxa filosa]|uniref:Uncharacterized protein n=1 Tax=Reticulomyxa filosa TaxID=46433 RepID=X6MV73_RETFI|nr:hypothetical protein RFI_20336 [Reticulomyxa filosa]|eukprot:ETO17000.1 hypothetical protein RFI_20336 [Reticulomyxa filosa]
MSLNLNDFVVDHDNKVERDNGRKQSDAIGVGDKVHANDNQTMLIKAAVAKEEEQEQEQEQEQERAKETLMNGDISILENTETEHLEKIQPSHHDEHANAKPAASNQIEIIVPPVHDEERREEVHNKEQTVIVNMDQSNVSHEKLQNVPDDNEFESMEDNDLDISIPEKESDNVGMIALEAMVNNQDNVAESRPNQNNANAQAPSTNPFEVEHNQQDSDSLPSPFT